MANNIIKKTVCKICKTDFSVRWYGGIENGWYCRRCWYDQKDKNKGFSIIGDSGIWAKKLRYKLPKNQVLGPEKKGTGMRGIYEISKK